jgi:hypothetical protein
LRLQWQAQDSCYYESIFLHLLANINNRLSTAKYFKSY